MGERQLQKGYFSFKTCFLKCTARNKLIDWLNFEIEQDIQVLKDFCLALHVSRIIIAMKCIVEQNISNLFIFLI